MEVLLYVGAIELNQSSNMENYACDLQPYQSSTELKTTVENQKLKGANKKDRDWNALNDVFVQNSNILALFDPNYPHGPLGHKKSGA